VRWDELVDSLEVQFGSPVPPDAVVLVSDDENAEVYDVETAESGTGHGVGHNEEGPVVYLHFGMGG